MGDGKDKRGTGVPGIDAYLDQLFADASKLAGTTRWKRYEVVSGDNVEREHTLVGAKVAAIRFLLEGGQERLAAEVCSLVESDFQYAGKHPDDPPQFAEIHHTGCRRFGAVEIQAVEDHPFPADYYWPPGSLATA